MRNTYPVLQQLEFYFLSPRFTLQSFARQKMTHLVYDVVCDIHNVVRKVLNTAANFIVYKKRTFYNNLN